MRLAAVVVVLAGCDRLFELKAFEHVDGGSSSSITLVQQNTSAAKAATMLSATLPGMPAPGNLLLMIGAAQTDALMTPTGGAPQWRNAARSQISDNVEIWYGVSDGSSATVSIAATTSGPMCMSVSEWSGVANMLDTENAMHGGAGTVTAGPITTIDAPDLIVFAVGGYASIRTTVTEDARWMPLEAPATLSGVQLEWYRIASTPVTSQPTTETTDSWDAVIAAFPAASP